MPTIDDPELTKPSGVVCPNCSGTGCKIYASRPQTCRDFVCEWRRLTLLDEDWRPDRSGVLITSRLGTDGAGKEIEEIVLLAFAGHDVIFDNGFATLVAVALDQGREVFLSLPSADFTGAWETTLRPYVASGLAAGSLAQVGEGIRQAYAQNRIEARS
jgi:hypothetical protein